MQSDAHKRIFLFSRYMYKDIFEPALFFMQLRVNIIIIISYS